MDDRDGIRINDRLVLPREELAFRATRSSGPGGQHVNTSSTRIELVWDLASSTALSDDQRSRLLEKLSSRIDGEGRLRIVAQEERSQLRNRAAALSRFTATIREALKVAKPRRPTKPTRAAKERRIKAKKQRGQLKRERNKRDDY